MMEVQEEEIQDQVEEVEEVEVEQAQ